jgi:hypothetical protein
LGAPLFKSIDTTPQHRFDAPRAKHCRKHHDMCLDVTGFMKDNLNARKDLAALCDHPSLEAKPNARGKLNRPKAPFCLKPIERKDVLR